MRLRNWRAILLLALLAVLSWQLSRRPSESEERPLGKPDTRLNYALYDFTGRLLDQRGDVNLRIESPVLRNDAASGIGTVDAPVIHIQQENELWYISAESAIISADREVVALTGEVYLSKRNELDDQLVEITTSDVVLNVTPRTARTESGVTIRQHNDRIDAVGMRLDMVSEQYELLHDVKGHYETM